MSDSIHNEGIAPPSRSSETSSKAPDMRGKTAVSQAPDDYVEEKLLEHRFHADDNKSRSSSRGRRFSSVASNPVIQNVPCPTCSSKLTIKADTEGISILGPSTRSKPSDPQQDSNQEASQPTILNLFQFPSFQQVNPEGQIMVKTEAELLSYIRKIFIPTDDYVGDFPRDRTLGIQNNDTPYEYSMSSTPDEDRERFYNGDSTYVGTYHVDDFDVENDDNESQEDETADTNEGVKVPTREEKKNSFISRLTDLTDDTPESQFDFSFIRNPDDVAFRYLVHVALELKELMRREPNIVRTPASLIAKLFIDPLVYRMTHPDIKRLNLSKTSNLNGFILQIVTDHGRDLVSAIMKDDADCSEHGRSCILYTIKDDWPKLPAESVTVVDAMLSIISDTFDQRYAESNSNE